MSLWTWLKGHIVQPAPTDIAACIECRECDCSVEERANCPRRIAEQQAIEGHGEPVSHVRGTGKHGHARRAAS